MYVCMVHVVHVYMYWTCVFGGVCMCMWLMYDCVCFWWCMSCMYVYIIHVSRSDKYKYGYVFLAGISMPLLSHAVTSCDDIMMMS